jgi:hypothetical protein
VARRPAQIPLDDEPVDIDLGDLPTDEELEAAAAASTGGEDEDVGGGGGRVDDDGEPAGPLELFQLWVVLVFGLYALTGLGVGLLMAFRGAAHVGMAAFKDPGFYLVILFWPITLWQLYWNQF